MVRKKITIDTYEVDYFNKTTKQVRTQSVEVVRSRGGNKVVEKVLTSHALDGETIASYDWLGTTENTYTMSDEEFFNMATLLTNEGV